MRSLSLISLCAASALLVGCAGAASGGMGSAPIVPTARFQLQVEPGLDRIALAVHEQGLSQAQQDALIQSAHRFQMEGAPAIRVEAPSGQDVVAGDMAWNVAAFLEHLGVPRERIAVVGYSAPDPRAPVLVGFDTVRAQVPRCGTQWTNLTRTGSNESWANFGCAVTANLAAQIADPRDIVQPRAMTPSDAGRRSVVYDNYRRGQRTAAQQETLVSNLQISDAVQ